MPNRKISCCFTGHRPGKLPWRHNEQDPRCIALKIRIADAVERAYEQGYRHFICGMAMGCDLYFCESALELQSRHWDVIVEAAIPCQTQADIWQEDQQIRYHHLVSDCDIQTVLSEYYTDSCMRQRNIYMIDHASLLIAAFNGVAGGTQFTIEYARDQGLNIWEIPV